VRRKKAAARARPRPQKRLTFGGTPSASDATPAKFRFTMREARSVRAPQPRAYAHGNALLSVLMCSFFPPLKSKKQ